VALVGDLLAEFDELKNGFRHSFLIETEHFPGQIEIDQHRYLILQSIFLLLGKLLSEELILALLSLNSVQS
jgi:hypothetical protein